MKVQRHLASLLPKHKLKLPAQKSPERTLVRSGHAVAVSTTIPSRDNRFTRTYLLVGLYVGLLACLLFLNYQLWFSEQRGWRDVERLQASMAAQKALNAKLLARNEQQRYEVISLKHGADALEERARADLGMIREGETLIQLLPLSNQ